LVQWHNQERLHGLIGDVPQAEFEETFSAENRQAKELTENTTLGSLKNPGWFNEHAIVIFTSNLPFGRRGEVFGHQTIAPAMIDRLVHHTEVHALPGNSYRKRERNLYTLPSEKKENST
jgi:hypothetical protein